MNMSSACSDINLNGGDNKIVETCDVVDVKPRRLSESNGNQTEVTPKRHLRLASGDSGRESETLTPERKIDRSEDEEDDVFDNGSAVDAGGFGLGRKTAASASWSQQSAVAEMPVDRDAMCYRMDHPKRGKCIIINNRDFSPSLDLRSRTGTDVDLFQLKLLFQQLKYDVQDYTNVSYKNMCSILETVSSEDHSREDSLVVCFLSHGDEGRLYATDRPFKPTTLWSDFTADHCRTLAGKPKLFFIQACQGDSFDDGKTLYRNRSMSVGGITETDSGNTNYTIPTHADFLIACSTVPGFYSWRNTTKGSWFIQALCCIVREYYKTKDLLSMMTIVNRKVALDYESNCPGNSQMDKKKQIPNISSMLTRDMYFV